MNNNDNNNNTRYTGISFTGLLTVVFIAFKLLGIIDWSWWWVLAPLWIPVVIVVIIMIFITLINK